MSRSIAIGLLAAISYDPRPMPSRLPVRYSPAAHEPALSAAARRASGVYYTPPEIARLIAELTLAPLAGCRELRILDPACGAGEFLVAARDVLGTCDNYEPALFGIDIDPAAQAKTRDRLGLAPADQGNIRLADALTDEVFPLGSFDVILGNPPYVSIRELARQRSPAQVAALRERFRTARGNFDLYVLFIERAIQFLRPGGRCGLIVPNKWATLDYARPCRELLLSETTIEQVIDLSGHRVFQDASVYPHVLVFSKRPAGAGHAIEVNRATLVPQHQLDANSISLETTIDVESQVPTHPLGQIARLQCGTAGYSAAAIGKLLVEADTTAVEQKAIPFITSGNIDRYQIRTGNVRYQGRKYRDPLLPLTADLSEAKLRLFRAPKIVIAGMSRRLEAAWDGRGLALGVQVFAASEFQVDPFYLLALLNSKLLSYLFRTRFAAKRLSGGYLAINKGQLAKLPIVVSPSRGRADQRRINRLAELAAALSTGNSRQSAADDNEIDQLVHQLYRLSSHEVAQVEAHFDELHRRHCAAA